MCFVSKYMCVRELYCFILPKDIKICYHKWVRELVYPFQNRFINLIQVPQTQNCLEGNTMSNRGAYSKKERMPSERKPPLSLISLEGCT